MITSENVRQARFDHAMRGYRSEEVDAYLNDVAASMDEMAAKNKELQEKVLLLAKRVAQYREEETIIQTTMVQAQRMGENVIREAKQKAAEIIRAANIKAEDQVQQAQEELDTIRQEEILMKREADAFRNNLLGMYRKHIELLKKIPTWDQEAESAAEAPASQPAAPSVQMEEIDISEPEPASAMPPAEPEYRQPVYPQQAAKPNTVELAAVPTPEEAEDDLPLEKNDKISAVADLYAEEATPVPAEKKPGRAKTRKATRKKEAPPTEEEPASFGGFNVGYDS